MKKNKKKMKVLCILIVFLMLSAVVYTTMSYANNKELYVEEIKISPKYLEWEQLSEEEKQETIMPPMFSTSIKDSIKRSTYNALIELKGSELGERYSLKDNLQEIIVKDQLQTEDCWAFSSTSMIETTLAKKYNTKSEEYSPMHMEYYVSNTFNKAIGAGANPNLVLAYLASVKGPVYEKDLPFLSVYNETNNLESNAYLKDKSEVSLTQEVRAQLKEATFFANVYKDYEITTDTTTGEESVELVSYKDSYDNIYEESEVIAFRNLVKEHIVNDGAVTACYHSATRNTDEGETEEEFLERYLTLFNPDNSAYYCNDDSMGDINHQITIIGWDDNYSKENFAQTPPGDGAYIILNSWGDEPGEGGYYYISYYDCYIESLIVGIDDIEKISEENPLDYDKLYEYDPLGMTFGFPWPDPDITSGYTANVFTRENTDEDEYLTEVGVFLSTAQGIEVYVNTADDDLTTLTKVAEFTGNEALTSGYHTIDITPTELTGDKFVVAVKYINEEGIWLPLECNVKDSGFVDSSNYYDTARSNEGESYLGLYGYWYDLYNLELSEQLGWTFKNTNACIKAFTTVQEPVTSTPVTGVTLDKTSASIEVDETVTLTATVNPTDATNKNVTWTSSDEDVATVLGGVVTGKSAGTTTITVTTEDGDFTATCEVTVTAPEVVTVAVTGVTLNKTTATIKEGASVTLTATVNPTNATNQKITWTSSDEDVATVLGGVVTGKSAGTTTITVTTEEGDFTATCEVTVEETTTSEEVKVTGVSLNKTTATIKKGATTTLVATITPSNAKNKNVTWTSSDEDIATVSETGVVVGESEGTATITVTTEDGYFTATCEVTVEGTTISEEVKVTGVSLNKTTATIKKGATTTLVATITPATATNKNVKWTSSDADIATVSSSGVVTGKSAGTATITVTTEDGGHIATCKVTVEEAATVVPVTSVSLNITSASIQEGETKTLVATINPSDATNKNVIWTSSDEEVATVSSSGIVTAKKAGTATITVTTEDGDYTATATITVTKKTNSDDDIYKDEGKDDRDPTYPGTLPETGEKLLIIASIAVVLVAGIVFVVKFKKYNLK